MNQHFFIPRPSKVYPNLDIWFENIPSGNPVSSAKSVFGHTFCSDFVWAEIWFSSEKKKVFFFIIGYERGCSSSSSSVSVLTC
jgi:hypothetical protein